MADTKIKFCGITNKEDALFAAALNVDMLGFVFYKNSRRCVDTKTAKDIINELPPFVAKVGVFVDEDKARVVEMAEECSLDILQFHGRERPDYCAGFKDSYKVIKAFRIKGADSLKQINDYDVDYYMLDAYSQKKIGGTGKNFDWKIAQNFELLKPVILSGGLTPENVADAIRILSPYGVDVSSGIERSPGRKDPVLMKKFVERVRQI